MKQNAFVHNIGTLYDEHPIKKKIKDAGLSVSEVWRRLDCGKSMAWFSKQLNGWCEPPQWLIQAIEVILAEEAKRKK